MKALGQEVNEAESLLINMQFYQLVADNDYLRLSQAESDRVFSSRSRKQTALNKENIANNSFQHRPFQTTSIPISDFFSIFGKGPQDPLGWEFYRCL